MLFRGPLSGAEMDHIHYWEVARSKTQLVTAGILGQVMVVTGTGADIATARGATYRLAARVVVPNLRYRTDIGERVAASDLAVLIRLGLFTAADFTE